MLTPSAHIGTFCQDNLPPEADWPDLLFDLPRNPSGELQRFKVRENWGAR
ncbi:hypothetical protein ACQPZ2_28820 [Nocardia pseudovaccinii]